MSGNDKATIGMVALAIGLAVAAVVSCSKKNEDPQPSPSVTQSWITPTPGTVMKAVEEPSPSSRITAAPPRLQDPTPDPSEPGLATHFGGGGIVNPTSTYRK